MYQLEVRFDSDLLAYFTFLKRRFQFSIVLLLFVIPVFPQVSSNQNLIIVGKQLPSIVLKEVAGMGNRSVDVRTFRGKWLILDFWNKSCETCIASFPKVNDLQSEFVNKIQFILVGEEDRQNQIRPMFAKFKEKLKLTVPITFDSSLFKRFDIVACPHIVIVDTSGVVKAVTTSVNRSNLSGLLDGKSPLFPSTYSRYGEERKDRVPYDYKKPLYVNGNGGNDSSFKYRSLITDWNPSLPKYCDFDMNAASEYGLFQVLACPLYKLFNYALIGKYYWGPNDPEYGNYYPYPILEVKDSTIFDWDIGTGRNLFCYSLTFNPKLMTVARIKQLMYCEIVHCFSYSAKLENRKVKYWSLKISDAKAASALHARGDSTYIKELPHASFSARNWPISSLIYRLARNSRNEIPFINETGILGNIDISLDCIMTDLEDVRKALKKYGLDVVMSEKEMFAVVIKQGD